MHERVLGQQNNAWKSIRTAKQRMKALGQQNNEERALGQQNNPWESIWTAKQHMKQQGQPMNT